MSIKKSRVLIPDEEGNLRKIVSVASHRDKKGLNVYFFFPKNFKRIVRQGTIQYNQLLRGDLPADDSVHFQELHLRYPPDGKVHISVKGPRDTVIDRAFVQHKPLSEQTAKLILTIIPQSPEHYPLHTKPLTELDWKIDGGIIPDFFINQPIRLNFWLGSGGEDTLIPKGKGVGNYEMLNTRKYAQVLHGIDDNEKVQLFLAVSKPEELDKFPEVMSIFLHSEGSPSLKKKIK